MFSGFLSVNAFAADAWLNVNRPANGARLYNGFIGATSDLAISSTILDPDEEGWYAFDNVSMPVTDWRLRFPSTSWKVVLSTEYDYYLTILIGSTDSANFKLNINNVAIREFDFDSAPNYKGHYLENLVVDNYDGYRSGDEFPAVAIFGKLASDFAGDISQILFRCSEGSVLPANVLMSINLFQVDKNTSASDVQKIVNAINNQTDSITGSIDQNTDDIQQSIEDQYEVDPDEDFNVDDIISEHNDKMGVLSFGSDVMLQFLDMFQSANVGTAELTLPGFNITVEDVSYSVWPDYSFNFEQLNEWVPALMSVIRVILPAFVWLMVLRYCIKVFEDNFLAK